MTSLVNASAVGFDLVRLPGGPAAARVLDLALGLAEGDLVSFVADRVPPVSAPSLPGAPAPGTHGPSGEHLATALRHAADLVGDDRAAEAVTLLHGVPVLGPDAVIALVRGDVLGWARRLPVDQLATGLRAVDLVLEAVAACWSGQPGAPSVRHVLAHPERAGRPGRPPVPLPGDRVLAPLPSLDAAAVGRLVALAATRAPGWAEAMHEATWAAHVTGRLRPAARSQMRAVVAVREAAFSTTDLASGLWNSLSGAVLAAAVGDVLDEETLAALRAPLAPWH